MAIAVHQPDPVRTKPAAFDALPGDRVRDAALMRRLAGGDREAFAVAYDLHSRAALAIALRVTRDRGSAEEAVQEAFVGLWMRADRYCPDRGTLRNFILGIVRHRALDLMRRDSLRARRRATDDLLELAPDGAPCPDVEVVRRAEAETVRAAVGELPAVQSEAVGLAYFNGLSHTEIADRLDVPLGTVKSRIRVGLANLREELPRPAL